MGHDRIIVLGATGSIGCQTLDIVRQLGDRFEVVGLAASSNWQRLAEYADRAHTKEVALTSEQAAAKLRAARQDLNVRSGPAGLVDLLQSVPADVVVVAIAGLAALDPLIDALRRSLRVAFASKEPLVAAGRVVMETSRSHGARLLPIDSEISAVFQCLQGVPRESVEKILLTASGGPFAGLSSEELARVTPEQALAHPTWQMGPKVTVDSASLMNKGFEVFELRWLFDVPVDRIEVVIHYQSVIHSAVQLVDSSVLAQMSLPDMRAPIQYALTYPERRANALPRLDLSALGQMTFARPDTARFPCLRIAYQAARAGGTYPAVLNAADEVAVAAFLEGRLGFTAVPALLEAVLEAHDPKSDDCLDNVLAADRWARQAAEAKIGVIAGRF
ncbi:MAG: 1-deoxy-D-xylulose-5-phosphate reductoisomerase [Armatimonadota bacterium]